MPPRQRFSQEDIVNAAFAIVRGEGWEGLSARSIAKELHSSTRPIYSYLASMKTLEEEVVKKALALFNDYLTAETTGDKWLDQAVGYVRFAVEEKMLFRCINDDKHIGLQRKNTRKMWEELRKNLADYEPFKNMTAADIDRIRVMRWFFIHGFSTLLNSGWFTVNEVDSHAVLQEMNIRLVDLIRIANQTVYDGLKDDAIFRKLGVKIYGKRSSEPNGGIPQPAGRIS